MCFHDVDAKMDLAIFARNTKLADDAIKLGLVKLYEKRSATIGKPGRRELEVQ